MKKAAVCFLKQVGSTVLGAVLKAKSLAAVKNKTSLLKARLMLLGLLPNKKLLLTVISNRMHALMAGTGHNKTRFAAEDYAKATVMYGSAAKRDPSPGLFESLENFVDEEEEEYPDLTHCLFDLEEDDVDDEEEEEDAVGNACSAVDLVRSSREDGAEFNLEDEIDHVADVFIRRFRRQMRFGEARIS